MNKGGLPEIANADDLKKGPEGGDQDKKGIEGHGGSPHSLGRKTAHTGHEEPREKDQGNGDFIAVELGEEFPDCDKLNRDGGYAGSDNGQYDEACQDLSTPRKG